MQYKIAMTTEDKIKSIISKALAIDISEVTLELSTGDIQQWDSVGNLNVIEMIQTEFNIEIPFDDLFELTSVQDYINEVKKLTHE